MNLVTGLTRSCRRRPVLLSVRMANGSLVDQTNTKQKQNDASSRARSFGIFRNKNLFRNIFRNIFRLFCSWAGMEIQVFRNENSSQTNAYSRYSNYSYSGLIPNERAPSCVISSYCNFVDSCKFAYNVILHTSELKIHTRQTLCHFGCKVLWKRSYFVKKRVPINRPGVFKWENFHPQSQYQFGGKHRDLGNRTGSSSRSHMSASRFLQRKLEWGETSVTGKARSIGLIKQNYRSTACVLFRDWQTAPLIRIDVIVDQQSGEEFFAQTCPFDYLHLFALCSERSFCRIRQVWLTHVLYTSTWMTFSTF